MQASHVKASVRTLFFLRGTSLGHLLWHGHRSAESHGWLDRLRDVAIVEGSCHTPCVVHVIIHELAADHKSVVIDPLPL